MARRRWTIPALDLVLVGLATGAVILAVLIVPGTGPWGTTFGGGSTAAFAADLAAGVALLLVGLLLRQKASDRRLGLLAVVAGLAWFAADLAGWHEGPAIVRAAAAIAAAAIAPLLFHLSAAASSGQRMSRAVSATVLLGYAVVAGLAAAGAMITDPRVDGGCWRDCRANPLLVVHVPGSAATVRDGLTMVALGCGLATAGLATMRLMRVSRQARSRRWPLLVTSVALGCALTTSSIRGMSDPVLRPEAPLDAALFLTLSGAVTAFAAALAWTVRHGRELIATLGELGTEPADPGQGGQVRQHIARAAGDPGLSIAYRLTEPERWIDADGREVAAPQRAPGQAVTPLVRGGHVLAAITHDPSVLTPRDLGAALGPATLLVIENERLSAGILAELSALRASRGEIVAAGDRERSRLERDLHDGAQQRLLALSYDLRMARAAAVADGLEVEVQQLDGLAASARAAHEELRELAHGIYPAILSEAGLGPALETLARRAEIPLDLSIDTTRADSEVENAAYAVVAAAVRDAAAMGATEVRVVVRRRDEALELSVSDDALDRGTPADLSDRVGAAGGTIRVTQDHGHRRLEATIPCV